MLYIAEALPLFLQCQISASFLFGALCSPTGNALWKDMLGRPFSFPAAPAASPTNSLKANSLGPATDDFFVWMLSSTPTMPAAISFAYMYSGCETLLTPKEGSAARNKKGGHLSETCHQG